jgi:uncharacterized repeat protein (TIGR03803 family)
MERLPAVVWQGMVRAICMATIEGGSSYFGTVFKLDPSGEESVLHTFLGNQGNGPDWGVVRDSKGNLYGTTQYGGAYGGGVVFQITP